MGQAKVLHDLVEERTEHATPPNCAEVMTLRERLEMPEPQVFEHEDQTDQLVILQSMGQAKVLQVLYSLV
jgi:hypothetical protein